MPELFVQSRNAMGTVFAIYLYAQDAQHAEAWFEAAFDEVERLEEALSHYRATSELSRINRLAARQAVTTDPEVFALLETSLVYSRQTGGAFDVTVGPLLRAWGFVGGKGRFPTDDELRVAKENVGFDKVHLDPAARTVRFASPGVELDLGAIGKGYAVDRTVKVLREAGVETALVDAGSSTVYAVNAPPGKNGWTVRVPQPGDRSKTVATVTLRNESLSTSGNYENFFQIDGRRYCHVIDPRQGMPVQGVLQTTLITSDNTASDALSNAMLVLGFEAGRNVLATLPDARGLWISGEPESNPKTNMALER